MPLGTDGENADEDQLDRALRDLTEGSAGAARFKEPSAAERDKIAKRSRKLNEEEAKKLAAAQKRNRKATRKQDRKAQKKARKAQRKAWGVKRSHTAVWAWIVAIIVLGGSGYFAYHLSAIRAGLAGSPDDTQLVTNGAVPSISSSPVSPLTNSGPPADPFAGTPADKWADGAAGITVPAARAHGGYSAAQVESAYQTTKEMLVAAALDNQTLGGGTPTAFADLMTQRQRTSFVAGLDKIGNNASSRGLVVSFAPGTTKLISSAIKVHGSMSAKATTDDHGQPVLEIDVNYLFTYAVEPPKAPADWMRIVAHFQGPVQFGNWAQANTPFEPWWQPEIWVAGARCSSRDGFIHPDYPNGPPDSVQPSGAVVNPYSLAKAPNGCNTTTGT